MVLELFFGIALLAVVVFVMLRMLGNITLGVVLVLGILLSSYFIMGSFPDLKTVPVIGQFIPEIPTGDAIAVIKDTLHSIDILGFSKASNGNLLVTVANTGQFEVSNFTAYVDGRQVEILNNKDTLQTKEVVTFELDWKGNFEKIKIKTGQAEDEYPPAL